MRALVYVMLAAVFLPTNVYGSVGGNWLYPNFDAYGTNYNPQTVINKENVGELELRWRLEIPFREGDRGYGVIAPPLLVNGVVYLATGAPSIIAVDASNARILWEYRPAMQDSPAPHTHGMTYFNGSLLYPAPDCSIRFVDTSSSMEKFAIKNICSNIPGNAGNYAPGGPAPAVDGVRKILVWGPSAAGGTAAGRGFVAGYSMDGTLLWRWFITPPAGGDPYWDFKYVVERGSGFFEGFARGNTKPVVGDWGDLGFREGRTRAGGGISFGHMSVDEEKGVVYLATANPKPDWNATYRPGPNLYTDSVVALNITTGDMLWFFQATPHDIYDYDCAWNTVLSKEGLVFKGCKNGVVYALNASDGSLVWLFNPPTLIRNTNQTLEKRWHTDPSDESFLQCPGAFGGIESDIALAYGKVYVAVMNLCTIHVPTAVEEHSPNVKGSVYNIAPTAINTTIYALDMRDGGVVWSFFTDSAYRGWLTATGGMVIAPTIKDGLLFLDAESGRLLRRMDLGGSLRTGAVVGSDKEGNYMVIQLVEVGDGVAAGGVKQILVALWPRPNPMPQWLVIPALASGLLAMFLLAYRTYGRRISMRRYQRPPKQ
jgi:alcohol dehydrogenase (cytochrome c)